MPIVRFTGKASALAAALATIAVLGGVAGMAAASDNERDEWSEAAAAMNANTSLTAAIATAEHEVGGKAIRAGFENQNGTMRLGVEIARDKTVDMVIIDATTGKVLKVVAAADNGEHGDDEHDED